MSGPTGATDPTDPGPEDTERREDGEEQAETGLGSGAVSGLGHSQTHEPDDLLDAGTGTEPPEG